MERRVAKTPETMVGIGIDMQFVVKTCGQTLFQRAHQFGWRTPVLFAEMNQRRDGQSFNGVEVRFHARRVISDGSVEPSSPFGANRGPGQQGQFTAQAKADGSHGRRLGVFSQPVGCRKGVFDRGRSVQGYAQSSTTLLSLWGIG